jgi:PAS domain S-box-containing protein
MTEDSESACHVLIVDDDLAARLMTRAALEQVGFTVSEAENGREALILALEAPRPDLILLDVIMPVMDGFDACAQLRTHSATMFTPILMMTGLDDVESIDRAYEVGATDFVSKPINYQLLGHRLRYMLRAQHTADALRESKSRLVAAQRIARLGHFFWDVDSGHVDASLQFNEIFGLTPVEKVETFEHLLEFVHPEDREVFADATRTAVAEKRGYSVEHRIIRSDGAVRTVYQEGEFDASPETSGVKVAATVQDITERRRMEKQMHQLAFFDAVTGLPNRVMARRHLAQALQAARQNGHALAVLVLDLDHFQRINENLGHAAGDQLLKLAGSRLTHCIRGIDGAVRAAARGREVVGDLVARLNGDEFIIILAEITNAKEAAGVARRVRDALVKACMLGDTEITISASVGISAYPEDSDDADTLIKQAEAAMHHAKTHGRDAYEFFTSSINERAVKQFTLENQLRKALVQNQFEMYYQPKVALVGQRVTGAEALVRWRHPELGIVSPAEFIPVAEDSGLIVPLGEWILREVCRQTVEWQARGLPPLAISVNLSAAQFRQKGIAETITHIVTESRADPALLDLELTESMLMEDLDSTISVMTALKQVGLTLSIDDFGIGYSSLSYLKKFPANTLKIDQSFVRDIATDTDDVAIITAIIALAHSLHLKVVAEGVENADQLRFLRDQGCEEVQGYFFSRPLTAGQFADWVIETRARPLRVATIP